MKNRLKDWPGMYALQAMILLVLSCVLTATANAAVVNNVQGGTATSNGNGTVTVPITAVDPTRAFLIFHSRHDSNRPPGSMIRGQLNGTGTAVEFTRVTNETSTMEIQWYVAEFTSGVSVQRGVTNHATAIQNIPITAVAGLSQTFVTWSRTPASTHSDYSDDDPGVCQLTSATNLQCRANTAAGTHDIAWQIVEFTNSADINVQRGTVGPNAMTGGTTQITVNLPTAVNVNTTMVLVGYTVAGGGADVGSRMLRAQLQDANTILVDRSISGDDIEEITWQAIEFLDGTTVQRGSESFSASGGAPAQQSMSQTHSTTSIRTAHQIASFAPLNPGVTPVVASTATATSTFNTSNLSWTHNLSAGGGTTRKLIVNIAIEDDDDCATPAFISGVTVGGQPMTQVDTVRITSSNNFCIHVEQWYRDITGLNGNQTIQINGAVTFREINAGSIRISNAANGNAEVTASTTSENQATISTNITPLTSNALLIDAVGSGNGGNFTPGGGQAEQLDVTGTTSSMAVSTKPVPASGGGELAKAVTITSVDTTRSLALASVQPAGGQNMGRSDFNSDDIIGTGSFTLAFTSATQLTITRSNGNSNADVGWFIVEFNRAQLFLEVDTVTLNNTLSTPAFTSVTFRQTYPVVPLVFALPTQDGPQPASIRVRNVTTTGFELSQVEPQNNDGPHAAMTVDYLVITPGVHSLPDGRTIEAGTHTTQSIQHGAGVPGAENWDTVNFTTSFAGTPSLLAQIQGLANESSNPPSTTSIPWLTASIQNVGTTSFQTALERSEVDDGGSINNDETIAYLAIEANVQGSFTAEGMTILYESIISADNINGWDNENCAGGAGQSVPFVSSYSTTPLAVAHTNRHDGGDGGWIRRCSIDTTQIGLAYDEDDFRDGERNHTTEAASVLVFSEAFCIPNCVSVVVDHYEISYPNGNIGITCEPSRVQITAHDSSDNPVNVPGGTSLDITSVIDGTAALSGEWDNATGSGSLSGNPGNPVTYTWPGSPEENSVTLELRQLATATLDINLDDGTATELEDPTIEFRDAIFRVVDATVIPVAISTKLSGKQSDTAGTGFQNLFLQAIETNDSLECQTVFENQSNVTVELASECNNPANCETVEVEVEDDSGSLVPIARNNNASVNTYTGVQFDFDADSKTPLRFAYDDAGQITLHARFDIDPPNNVFMQGSSNAFVVRPAGLCVESNDANSDCISGDGTCTAFVKADDPFNLTVRAVTWESDAEVNSDFCAGSNVDTPNFELSTIPLTHTVVAPGGGNSGGLGVNNIDIVDADNGSETINNQTISEVGVFTVTATPPSYIGETIAASSSANIGRFFPDRFVVVADGSPAFANECTTGTPFTYLDQTFRYGPPPALTLQALNVNNVITLNYGQDFWKLTVTALDRSYSDNAGAAAGFSEMQDNTVTVTGDNDLDGTAILTLDAGVNGDAFLYSRAVEEGEFNADVDVVFTAFTGNVANTDDLTDSDNVCHDADDNGSCDDFTISNITATAGGTLRFGRLVIGTAFGSELLPLTPVFQTQYFDAGPGTFIPNTDDGCTSIAATDLSLTSAFEGPETDGDVVITSGGSCPGPGNGCTTATPGNEPFVAGDGALEFSAPGADNTGHADIAIDLSTVPLAPHANMNWLRYDWDDDDGAGDGPYDDDPDGRVTFGIYQGPSDYIYIREPW